MSNTTENVRISEDAAARFIADFHTMSEFGATGNGGVDRQAASPADIEQRRWFAGLLEENGFRVEYDRIGNQFGLLELTPGAPFVVVGSHMDSQPTAGKYDGAYGVLAAAHSAFRLAKEWAQGGTAPMYNLAVVNWFNEEGSRFAPSMMGSGVYTGVLPLETALAVTDRHQVSVQEALAPTGFLGDGDGPRAAFCAEIHIEQGRLLENAGTTIGLVTASWAASKYVVTVQGEQSHSGATVMDDRRDALYGAALLVVFARELADRFPGVLHTAVGQLDLYPNSPVVVASQVTLLLDLRCADEAVLAEANEVLAQKFDQIEQAANVRIARALSHEWGLNPYQPAGVELARAVSAQLDYPHGDILTVAGHDSTNMKEIVPTVMLFVPSVDGVSHNEGEYTRDADLIAGLDVLTGVVRQLTEGGLAAHQPDPENERQTQRYTESTSMSTYAITDPATGEVVRSFPTATDREIEQALTDSAAAYPEWRRRPIAERAALLAAVAGQYRADRVRLAEIMTQEMGKTLDEALGEIDLVADIFDYYATHGEGFVHDKPLDIVGGHAVVRTDPIGVVLGIMPWNYPHYQVARLAAPNLLLGNTVILKHAPSCPASALAIAEILHRVGVPLGAYVNVFATNEQIAHMIEAPAVQGVSLTGSERAGRAVGELAGRAMKKMVLELGGSDPFIVLPDADLDAAATAAVVGRMGNAGQACTASKRFIVVDDVYDAFLERFTEKVRALNVGDPREPGVDLGPLSSEGAARHLGEQVDDAVAHGARLVVGGGRVGNVGAFVEPTILTDVPDTARAYREELFGPVAVVYRVADVDEAIRLANDSPFGLGSVVFGTDQQTLESVAAQLEAGMVSLNGPAQTQPDLPFGGVKASGVGRELGSFGMMEFANHKIIRTHASS